jgi:hypothetical protein
VHTNFNQNVPDVGTDVDQVLKSGEECMRAEVRQAFADVGPIHAKPTAAKVVPIDENLDLADRTIATRSPTPNLDRCLSDLRTLDGIVETPLNWCGAYLASMSGDRCDSPVCCSGDRDDRYRRDTGWNPTEIDFTSKPAEPGDAPELREPTQNIWALQSRDTCPIAPSIDENLDLNDPRDGCGPTFDLDDCPSDFAVVRG